MIHKLLIISLISILFSNCESVKEYNYNLTQPISVKKLQKDIDFTQRKLNRFYPNLYGYISKKDLDFKFDSIRKVVNKPMTSKEFFFIISPLIASVRQGHMTMWPVFPKLSKKVIKEHKKVGFGPLSKFEFEWENDKLFVIKINSENKKIRLGTEVISINQIKPHEIYNKYRNSITSDGFNKTFIRKFFSIKFKSFLINEIGLKDSLNFVFKYKDSVYEQFISGNKINKTLVANVKAKDSIKQNSKNSINKMKLKKVALQKKIFGYDNNNKEYLRRLSFFEKDSTVAMIRIKKFSGGKFNKAYNVLFDSIKNKKCKSLILDLRDNPGGSLNDIENLNSYLTDKEFRISQPPIVASKTSLFQAKVYKFIPKISYPIATVLYPLYLGFTFFSTTKNKAGEYQSFWLNPGKKINAKNYFDGKLYVLINGGSFSASCVLSSSLKSNPNVVFVGEETGGAFNGTVAGLMPKVILPNSKISFNIGLMNIKPINQTEIIGRGIFPDFEIPLTVEDKVNKNDPQLDWILKDIKNKGTY